MWNSIESKLSKLWQLWTLPVLICAFGMGILCALLLPFQLLAVLISVLVVVVCLVLGFWKKCYLVLVLAALGTGFTWTSIDVEALQREAALYPQNTVIETRAVVTDSPVWNGEWLKFTVKPEGRSVKLLVYTENIPIKYGDEVWITGKTSKNKQTWNEGAFDYDRYLLTNRIVATVFAENNGVIVTDTGKGNLFIGLALKLREQVEHAIAYLPEQQAKFVAGMVLGDKADLEATERQILSQTGIMHLFSVSGGNVAYVVMLAFALAGLCRLKRWGKLSMVVAFVGLFSVMTGFSPPVVRSSIMAVFAAAALILGEKSHGPTSLFLAAFLCLLWRPMFLFDAGFQLSFVATAGIIFTLDLLPKNYIGKYLGVSLAAQLSVAALSAYYFNIFTVVGLLLSPLAVALSGMIVILGLLSVPFSLIACGDVPIYGAGLLSQLMFDAANWCNGLPGAYRIIASPDWFVLSAYYVLLIITVWFLRKPHKNRKEKWFAALPILLAVALLFLPAKQPGTLQITFMDVGQGDGILIQTPAGNDILVDAGGSDFNPEGTGEYTVVPYLRRQGIADIELMMNSHPHADHAGGLLAVLKQMPVETLLLADVYENVPLQEQLLDAAAQHNAAIQYVHAGTVMQLEENLLLTVYSPQQGAVYTEEDANRGSLVMQLSYGAFDILFTGDLDGMEQTEFLVDRDWSGIEYLQIPHHGSKNSYDENWYAEFNPQGVIISVGRNNSYGHPAEDVVQYWQQQGAAVYRTDQNGAVSIHTNGNSWYVSTYVE